MQVNKVKSEGLEKAQKLDQYVVFGLENQNFAFKIDKVKETIKMRELTSLPEANRYVEGMIDLRSEIVYVINLKDKLGLNYSQKYDDKSRMIILDLDNFNIAFIVDTVYEVIKITKNEIETEGKNVVEEAELFEGIYKQDDKLIIILELEDLLREFKPKEEIQSKAEELEKN